MKIKAFHPGLIGVLIFAFTLNLNGASSLQLNPWRAAQQAQTPSTNQTIYLPVVLRNYPPPPTIFGVELAETVSTGKLDQVSNANIYWMRNYMFSWEQIEPVRTSPPTYHWESVNEIGLREAHLRNIQVIATIKYTPAWAQKLAGHSCGPIAPAALGPFAQFMQALVSRYGSSDYQVKYWEIGNEPDVDPSLVPADSLFGCWGDQNDAYYGGGYYAEMLKAAYPAVKAADPGAKVLIGGLLLDCDPTHPPSGKDCKPAKFLEGILQNQGGNYFDIVNYHGYAYFNGGVVLDETYPPWAPRGGVLLGKADYLRSVMASHGLNKPVINTESSLICTDDTQCPADGTPSAIFLEAQADYLVSAFVRAWSASLLGNVWYEIEGPGWRECGLLNSSGQPRPAMNAYQFLTMELSEATYSKQVMQYSGTKAYEFSKPGKRIWVLWSADGQPHSVSLPAGVTQIYDKYGTKIPPSWGPVTIKSPIYVELAP